MVQFQAATGAGPGKGWLAAVAALMGLSGLLWAYHRGQLAPLQLQGQRWEGVQPCECSGLLPPAPAPPAAVADPAAASNAASSGVPPPDAAAGWRGAHKFNLTSREMERGLVMYGERARARRALQRVLAGQPLRMGTVGGSITKGHNALFFVSDYSTLVFNWIKKAFPDAQHDLVNGAVGAVQSTYFSLCLEWHVPADVDIVVLETNINDGADPPNGAVRRAHERLVRKVLSLPSRPAVLELTFYYYPENPAIWTDPNATPYRYRGDDEIGVFAQARLHGQPGAGWRDAWDETCRWNAWDETLATARARACVPWPPRGTGCQAARHAAGAPSSPVPPPSMQFYRLPWISIRSLAWGGTPETAIDPNSTDAVKYAPIWASDKGHPTEAGHKYMADMIIHWMQQTLDHLERFPYEPADEAVVAAPLAMPLYVNNWEGGTHTCLMADKFQAAVTQHDEAFQWVSEGANKKKPKFGWVSTQPGSSLVIALNTQVGHDRSSEGNVSLGVGHLRSYEHMGTFTVQCMAGCQCESITLDGAWEKKESQMYLAQMVVPAVESCSLKVTVLNETSSGEHKVKLLGVIISEVPGMLLHTDGVQPLSVRFGQGDGGKYTLNIDETDDT